MNTQIAYCGVNCFTCSDYINKICPSCKHTQWTEEDICMPVKCCKEKGQIFMRSQKVTKKHITEWY